MLNFHFILSLFFEILIILKIRISDFNSHLHLQTHREDLEAFDPFLFSFVYLMSFCHHHSMIRSTFPDILLRFLNLCLWTKEKSVAACFHHTRLSFFVVLVCWLERTVELLLDFCQQFFNLDSFEYMFDRDFWLGSYWHHFIFFTHLLFRIEKI